MRSIASLLAASLMGVFAAMPQVSPAGVVPHPVGFGLTAARGRSRIPHSNREHRRKHGIPHGYPGAKLARKAAAGRIGLRG